ncbi:hypothetical protein GF340_04655, partial [Candidatus Peregrinibacteria bacterium]|nr:hypothetical protein [Candidatus Peregrinibacteria bacterium]
DYFHKPFQGKKVKFKIHVHEVEEVKVPEWTPEFIKEITGKEKQLDEMKKDIETNLLEEKKHGVKVKMENEFLDKIAELTKVEVPEALIEEEVNGMIDEMKSEMESKGIPFEKYLEDSKKTMEELKKQRMPEAEKRLTLRFGLQELFKEEGMDVSEGDVKKEMEHMIELYPDAEKEKVRKEYKDNPYLSRRLENKLKMDKLFAKYLYK